MRHSADMLVHVPTYLGDSQLAESYRFAGRPQHPYTHPQAVSRYAIGGNVGATQRDASGTRFQGVGHE